MILQKILSLEEPRKSTRKRKEICYKEEPMGVTKKKRTVPTKNTGMGGSADSKIEKETNNNNKEISDDDEKVFAVKQWKCFTCEKNFVNKQELSDHVVTNHKNVCPFCEKPFIFKSKLKIHFLEVHK